MIRASWLAVPALVLLGSPALAQPGGRASEKWTVKFETVEGESVTGKLDLSSIAINCNLGHYEIKPDKIKSIELEPVGSTPNPGVGGGEREGTVITASDEKVAGKINLPRWTLETDLGTLTPDPKHLKKITIMGRASDSDASADEKKGQPGQQQKGQPNQEKKDQPNQAPKPDNPQAASGSEKGQPKPDQGSKQP